MSVAAKRRETEVFSLAFLDCICCGFGAVLLVFILSLAQKRTTAATSATSAGQATTPGRWFATRPARVSR